MEIVRVDISDTLKDRGAKYGAFVDHARITQNLKELIHTCRGWERLTPAMREAMDMTMHKYGRILNGDPTLHDSWHDVVGYNKLVADTLIPETK